MTSINSDSTHHHHSDTDSTRKESDSASPADQLHANSIHYQPDSESLSDRSHAESTYDHSKYYNSVGVIGFPQKSFNPYLSYDQPVNIISTPRCPYKPGAELKLIRSGERMNATIVKVFRGGKSQQFSNSCTVLILIREAQEVSLCGRQMVLKILDWRYMTSHRKEHFQAPWGLQRFHDILTLTDDERHSFQSWLLGAMSEDCRRHPQVQSLCDRQRIPAFPTNMDLFAYVLQTSPRIVRDLERDGLIPVIPAASHQEIFLFVLAMFQLAFEDHMSHIVFEKMPHRMPKAFGVFDVSVVQTMSSICKRARSLVHKQGVSSVSKRASSSVYERALQIFQVQALLMEEVPGRPVATLTNITLADEAAKAIVRQLVSFQVQLWRCNLELWDANTHNILLDEDRISVVDFGALSIIHSDLSDLSPMRVRLPATQTYSQLPGGHCRPLFDNEVELNLVYGLLNCLTESRDTLNARALENVTSCFSSHASGRVGTFTWYIIMLHIIYSYDEVLSADDLASLIPTLHLARQIMIKEISKDLEDSWWARAIRGIAYVTMGDENHAISVMSHLIELWNPTTAGCHRRLPMLLVQACSEELSEYNPGLLFPRRAHIIRQPPEDT